MGAAGASDTMPERLLLIYALECGMKALIMKERGAEITSELPLIINIGHDLRECLKALYAPPRLTLRNTKTKQKSKQDVRPSVLHQAFRYNIEVEDVTDITAELKEVHEWLKERMR
jgi:hypothetical protein